MTFLEKLKVAMVSAGVGIFFGVGAAVLAPVSIPVAIGIGIGVSVVAGASNLGLIVYGVSLGRKEEHGKQNENIKDVQNSRVITHDIIKSVFTDMNNQSQQQHKEQMEAIRQVNSAVNTHAETSKLLLESVDSKLDYHLDQMHESKKHQPEDEPAVQPDAVKVKVSDALAKHGIHASANKENIEPEVAEMTDDVKPIRKRLRV